MQRIYINFIFIGSCIAICPSPSRFIKTIVSRNKGTVSLLVLTRIFFQLLDTTKINLNKICNTTTLFKTSCALWSLSAVDYQLEEYLANQMIYRLVEELHFVDNVVLELLSKNRAFYKKHSLSEIQSCMTGLAENTVNYIDSAIVCFFTIVVQIFLALLRSEFNIFDPDMYAFLILIVISAYISTFNYNWPKPIDYLIDDLLNNIEFVQDQGQESLEAAEIRKNLLLMYRNGNTTKAKQMFLQSIPDILLIIYFFIRVVLTEGEWNYTGKKDMLIRKGYSTWNSMGRIRFATRMFLNLDRKLDSIGRCLKVLNAETRSEKDGRITIIKPGELTVDIAGFKYPQQS